MKYFYYINFSEKENDPVKILSEKVSSLKRPLIKSEYFKNKKEVIEAFNYLKKTWVKQQNSLFIVVYNNSKKVLPLIKKLCGKGIDIKVLTLVSPCNTIFKTKIPPQVENFVVFKKPSSKNGPNFNVNLSTTQIRQVFINDADFLVNSKAIQNQQIEFVKRLV